VSETPQNSSLDAEASEADVQEQAVTVADVEADLPSTGSAEVDEFDAAEQGRAVDLDPDEYR
jgi:hypothetical protein